MELLRSALLRVPHGFPTRAGGVSVGAFSSLNASPSVGDDVQAVTENLGRLASAAGVEPTALHALTQVHADTVLEAGGARAESPLVALGEADASWTKEPNVALGIRTADCVPVLLEDSVLRRVGAAHAGWRGVIAMIATKTISAMGSNSRDVKVAIGPCIQACCFEVDGDLPERFEKAFGPSVLVSVRAKAKVHLDLPRAVRLSLERSGVPSSAIDVLPHCTMCDARFFSHRRDRGVTGRHLSFITNRFDATPL